MLSLIHYPFVLCNKLRIYDSELALMAEDCVLGLSAYQVELRSIYQVRVRTSVFGSFMTRAFC